MDRSERDILIGKVTGPFGIRGEVKILVLTDFPERFEKGREIVLNIGNERRKAKIESSRPHAGVILAKLEGVDNRNEAEQLRNAEIVIDRDQLAKLEEGRFYVFDIIGLKAITEDGRELGTINEVLQGGANDVYCTDTGLCIPALKNIVIKIDIENGVMVIRPMPGLLPDEV